MLGHCVPQALVLCCSVPRGNFADNNAEDATVAWKSALLGLSDNRPVLVGRRTAHPCPMRQSGDSPDKCWAETPGQLFQGTVYDSTFVHGEHAICTRCDDDDEVIQHHDEWLRDPRSRFVVEMPFLGNPGERPSTHLSFEERPDQLGYSTVLFTCNAGWPDLPGVEKGTLFRDGLEPDAGRQARPQGALDARSLRGPRHAQRASIG